jgi:hypothetical protein
MKNIKDYLDDEVLQLWSQIESLCKKYDDKCSVIFKNTTDFHNLSEVQLKFVKNLEYLGALSSLGDYENILSSQTRELIAEHKTLVDPPTNLKPSGKESCCIKLWSGTPEYQDKYETQHEVIKAKFQFVEKGEL